MSVLIDPYMFELSDTQEIENNISFFLKMIKLCTKSDNNQRLHPLLYKGLFEKICQRAIQPFPINIHTIVDSDLRKTILQINKSFNHALLESIESIDIDDKILTGIKKDGRHIGDVFQILCSCSEYKYKKLCVFSEIDEFISKKEKVRNHRC